MFDSRISLSSEVRADIEQFLDNARDTDSAWADAKVFPTYVRRNIKLAEAPSYGKTIFEYEENCHGAEDYRMVAEFIHTQYQLPPLPEALEPAVADEFQEQSDSSDSPPPETSTAQTEEQPVAPPIEIKEIPQQTDSPAQVEPVNAPTDDVQRPPEIEPNEPESYQPGF